MTSISQANGVNVGQPVTSGANFRRCRLPPYLDATRLLETMCVPQEKLQLRGFVNSSLGISKLLPQSSVVVVVVVVSSVSSSALVPRIIAQGLGISCAGRPCRRRAGQA